MGARKAESHLVVIPPQVNQDEILPCFLAISKILQ